jgi:hypothetical protein
VLTVIFVIRVPTRAALMAFYRWALACGVPMPLVPQDFGAAWSVFVTDPEGNNCEVYWATDRPPAAPRPVDPAVLTGPDGDDVQTADANVLPRPGGRDGSVGDGCAGGQGRYVSSATFAYLSAYTWARVVGWLRRKHRRITWKHLRRRYCAGGWWPGTTERVLFNPAKVPTTRYRYRGQRSPAAWPIPG